MIASTRAEKSLTRERAAVAAAAPCRSVPRAWSASPVSSRVQTSDSGMDAIVAMSTPAKVMASAAGRSLFPSHVGQGPSAMNASSFSRWAGDWVLARLRSRYFSADDQCP
jgi:hypothetical protein